MDVYIRPRGCHAVHAPAATSLAGGSAAVVVDAPCISILLEVAGAAPP